MMEITKFPQSCIVIETKGKKILIDPGTYVYEQTDLKPENCKGTDFLLITHKHGDHCLPEAIKIIKQNNPKMVILCSSEVKKELGDLDVEVVKEGDIKEYGDIKIEVVKAVHGYIPWLKGEKEIHENIGYIIDDGDKRAYHCSDTICFENDYKCDVIFVPVSGHGVVMGIFEAGLFAKETEAELVIPFHYDNPIFPVDLEDVKKEFDKQEINYKILKNKESVEI